MGHETKFVEHCDYSILLMPLKLTTTLMKSLITYLIKTINFENIKKTVQFYGHNFEMSFKLVLDIFYKQVPYTSFLPNFIPITKVKKNQCLYKKQMAVLNCKLKSFWIPIGPRPT